MGYYLAARMLWDVKEVDRIDALIDDFLDKAFGSAREAMADTITQNTSWSRVSVVRRVARLRGHVIPRVGRTFDVKRALSPFPYEAVVA